MITRPVVTNELTMRYFYKHMLNNLGVQYQRNGDDIRVAVNTNQVLYRPKRGECKICYCYVINSEEILEHSIFDSRKEKIISKWLRGKSTVTLWSWIGAEWRFYNLDRWLGRMLDRLRGE